MSNLYSSRSSISGCASKRVTELKSEPTQFRRPESVLVIVHTVELDCLMLERVDPPGFWQSVTGALRWGETAAAAARREVSEETGIEAGCFSDAGVTQCFPILPAWRARYAPDVAENTEHLWYLELAGRLPVRLNAAEHCAYRWLPVAGAIELASSWTNREGLQHLAGGL
jgi:dATP pyrophosphohydrolase